MKRDSSSLHALVCLLMLGASTASAQTITSVVGTGAAGSTGDGGFAINATLNVPYRVVVDATNNLLIVEQSGHRVRRVSAATGVITTIAGTGTAGFSGDGAAATAAQLNSPNDVTLDSVNGDIIIADTGNHRIRRIVVATGVITTVGGDGTAAYGGDNAPATQAQLNTPVGVVVEANGNILICDLNNNRIRCIIAATSDMVTIAGTGVPGFTADGGAGPLAQMRRPRAITLNAAGNIFFSDSENHRVRRITAGIVTTVAGNGTAGFSTDGILATNSQLNFPHGLAVHPDGSVFIADSANNRIRVVDPGGIIATFANTSGATGSSGDGGAAAAALLRVPRGMGLDSNTNLFFADSDNHKVRRISPPVPGVAANIVVQPAAAAAAAGNSVSLNVTAAGTAPLAFQWFFTNGPVASATNATLTFNPAQLMNSGGYFVIVTNSFGSVTSTVVSLTVTNFIAPPTLATQPASQTVVAGTTVMFTVVAAGTAPLAYQWRTNGVNLSNGGRISGATSATLTVSSAVSTDAGAYDVVVTNLAGIATSSGAALIVNTPPTITSQPLGASVNSGVSVTFSVVAAGTVPLAYQWRRNGTNFVNATNTSFTVTNTQSTNAGNYSVVVSNVAGTVTSIDAPLVINGPPVVLEQPQGATVNLGTVLNLYVTGTSPTQITYQWRLNGTNLAGQTANGITVAVYSPALAGNFTVVLANAAGSVTSAVAAIVIATPPVITAQPQNTTVAAGAGAVFTVASSGTTPFTYQWQLNGTNLPNATNMNFTLATATTNDAGPYRVAVSNMAGGVFSSNAVLTVLTPPVLVVQPADLTVFAGSNATFSATASGLLLFYQWRQDGLTLAGMTNTTLTLTNAVRTNAGAYTLLVTNLAGMTTSSPALLTVRVRQRIEVPSALGGGVFRLRFGFEDGVSLGAGDLARFDAQTTTNLVDWMTLTNALSLINGQLQLDDSGAPQFFRRFYRIVER